ncbi:sensor histidine kinase [Actinomyces sp. oral taxon 414]|uniref:sensor histidine kinase n=1 Tax=Actinomyces sp. oral taxon 414 TaxID=712122 RepID=UPI0006AE2558|nr:histidine kinase [Actinomyces sp. oral taxon 414]
MVRRRRPTGLRYLQILGVVALALVSIGGTWAGTRSWGLTAGAALALIALRWCGRHADAVLGVHGLLCAVQIIVTDSVLPADLPMTVSLYAVGRRGRRELTPLWTAAVVIGAALGSWDWSRDKLGFPTYYRQSLLMSFAIPICVSAISWGLGRSERQHQELAASRVVEAEALAAEARARQAESAARLAEEEQRHAARDAALRTEIAREVHDVVGHALALIAVQAEAGHYLASSSDDIDVSPPQRLEQAAQALGTIRRTARSALADTRGLTRTLTSSSSSPESGGPLRPVPGLSDLPRLVNDVRAAGLPVELRIDDPPPGRPALGTQAGLALYRTAQESLTNVLKHAGPASVDITVEHRDDDVVLTVTDRPDDGPGADPDPAADAPSPGVAGAAGVSRADAAEGTVRSVADGDPAGVSRADAAEGPPRGGCPGDPGERNGHEERGERGGQGLANLRRRLEAVGGDLKAGPRPGGGFAVRARIPATTAAERDVAAPSTAQPASSPAERNAVAPPAAQPASSPAVPEERDAAAAHLRDEAP